MTQVAPNAAPDGELLMQQMRAVLRGLIHQRWRSMRDFARDKALSPDWVTNRVGVSARTAIDIADLAVFADALGVAEESLVQAAREFPLRAEWNVIDGEGLDAAQGVLPFRAQLQVV